MSLKLYKHDKPFPLELGGTLNGLEIGYHTYGTLNAGRSNVVWVLHHLTANPEAADWWGDLVGRDKLFDPERWFIVCANNLGSCYGTTGPLSADPATGKPCYHNFPYITMRDIVQAHLLLKQHLGVEKIHTAIGGSMGGYQALEWCIMEPETIQHAVVLATNARETAWAIGIHETQRMALSNCPTWRRGQPGDAAEGLALARAIGMLSYRGYEIFRRTQTDEKPALRDFRAASYLRYQGEKLVKRFNAYSYWTLTYAMDSHDLGRGRTSAEKALAAIRARTLVIGITGDILCPLPEQRFLARHIPGAVFVEINSDYGHDGFMVEAEQITKAVRGFLGRG